MDEGLGNEAVELVCDLERILCDTPQYALSAHDVEVTLPRARAFLAHFREGQEGKVPESGSNP